MDYHQLKFSIEWQMQKFNLSKEEAETKIVNMRKSFGTAQVYSVEWQMQKHNITREEAEQRIFEANNKIRNTQNKMSEFDFKSMCSKNSEHWIKKGYDENEAKKIAKEQLNHMQSSYQQQRKENPEKYNNISTNQINYWLKIGFSEKEAKEKVKERQAVGRLDKFIERYGEEEDTKRWKERQIKWQKTLNDKSLEEKQRINKLKGATLRNMIKKWGEIEGTERYDNLCKKRSEISSNGAFYSLVSQKLFYELLKYINDKENVKYATYNGEKVIHDQLHYYLYDFCYNKKIIEFNGDIWHANPTIYKETDTPNPYLKFTTSKEIWQHDNNKNNIAKNKGYEILVIWEKDYNENKNQVISECLNFLSL